MWDFSSAGCAHRRRAGGACAEVHWTARAGRPAAVPPVTAAGLPTAAGLRAMRTVARYPATTSTVTTGPSSSSCVRASPSRLVTRTFRVSSALPRVSARSSGRGALAAQAAIQAREAIRERVAIRAREATTKTVTPAGKDKPYSLTVQVNPSPFAIQVSRPSNALSKVPALEPVKVARAAHPRMSPGQPCRLVRRSEVALNSESSSVRHAGNAGDDLDARSARRDE